MPDEKEPVKLRVFPGEKTDSVDLVPEEVLSKANEVMKERWLSIFIQLSNSPRFLQFLEDNYVIGDKLDHEANTIETMVVEKPTAVGPALTLNQAWQIRQEIRFSGATNSDSLLKSVLKILGQEPPNLIMSATDADIKQAVDAEESLKKKLDG